ncbi:putative Holliday junction resolvase [Parapoxvirus red deer/HL953]|uniref:Putative Holliday junction resolvase n=1 Tax=Parapoxvirus red deer/HL953 TaxID=1579460 RepID=A0A0A7M9T7_9POXV|nr:putative Holliday junction resolvase [Parapoxvirus red deer/HL953]AIZ77350.1 putative Holliday junction resolvase [Parapoxvirus red deer/HL953]
MIVAAFDLGTKNPARTVLEVLADGVRVLDVSKLDWSRDWEKRVHRDVTAFPADVVLVERQCKMSPFSKFIHFIRGLLFEQRRHVRVIAVPPAMTGSTYRARKRRSVRTFLALAESFGILEAVPARKKLDDVADSFNMAINYVLKQSEIR